MDIRMPRMDGLEATRQIIAGGTAGSPRVLILTTFDLDEYVYDALERRRQRIPAQGRPTRAARRRDPCDRRRRIAARADRDPTTDRGAPARPPTRSRSAGRARRADRPRARGVHADRPWTVQRRDRRRSCSYPARPSRPTSPAFCRNSTFATASRPSYSPTNPGSPDRATHSNASHKTPYRERRSDSTHEEVLLSFLAEARHKSRAPSWRPGSLPLRNGSDRRCRDSPHYRFALRERQCGRDGRDVATLL